MKAFGSLQSLCNVVGNVLRSDMPLEFSLLHQSSGLLARPAKN